jgi:hypothetical protein
MSGRNLPGFLRRSGRWDEDEEDEEDYEPEVSKVEPVESNGSSNERRPSPPSSNSSLPEVLTPVIISEPMESYAVGVSLASQSSFRSEASSKLSDNWLEIPDTSEPFNDDSKATPKLSFRELQFEKTLIQPEVVNMSELRQLAWNGIPTKYRATTWKILLGYLPTNSSRRDNTLRRKRNDYRDARSQHYDIDDNSRTAQEQETLRQVIVDVPRTAPDISLFRNDRVRRILQRVLYVWAIRHPASSYVQGINDLATPLVTVFLADYYQGQDVLDGDVMNHLSQERLDDLEADVYWCLTSLLAGIQDHYTCDQPGIQRMVGRLEELVNRMDGPLCQHLRGQDIEFLQFSFKWMNCLLLREFHLSNVPRLWDTYIAEKNGFEDFHVYVCAAYLCQFSSQLQGLMFDDLFRFFQNVQTNDWGDQQVEMLLSQAFVLSTLFGGSDAHLTAGNNSR